MQCLAALSSCVRAPLGYGSPRYPRPNDGFTVWHPVEFEEPAIVLDAKRPAFRGKHATEYEEFRTMCDKALFD